MPGQRSKFYTDTDLKMSPEEEQQNARELVDYYRICFAHPAVEGILMWGFWEGANWIPASSLYTRDWQPKVAAQAYQDLVFGTWWTEKVGTTDGEGNYTLPAFYGDYQITVNGQSKKVSHQKARGETNVEFPRP